MPDPTDIHAPVLQWAIIDDCLQYLPDFDRSKRTAALCPVCKRPVILKLGPFRAHHIAHYPGDVCVANQPETVIHLNTKYYLQKVLRTVHSLFIMQPCSGSRDGWFFNCGNERPVKYVQDWNQVETEWPFGPYRLDVALLRQGQVVGAIEVLVFHPCEEEKVAYLNAQDIPWLEIRGTPELYSFPGAWQASQPLTPEQHNEKLVHPWQCPSCREKDIAKRKEKERFEREAKDKEQKRAYAKQFEILAVRVVDFYYPSGKKYRSVYVIETKVENGRLTATYLQEIGSQRRTIATFNQTLAGDAVQMLKGALKVEILAAKNNTDWLVDDSLDWKKSPTSFHPKMYMDLDRYPYRFEWDGSAWKNAAEQWQERIRALVTEMSAPKSFEAQLLFDQEYTCRKCGEKTKNWVTKYDSKTCLCRNCYNTEMGFT